jgi:hypothetical protein
MKKAKEATRNIKNHTTREETIVEKLILVEWNFGDKSSSEGERKKVAIVAIKKLPSTSRLFNNLTDDEESSSIHCFMTKGEKVKTSSKPSPPPSDESEMDSSDASSDEEVNQLVSEMNKQSRDFMAKLVVELEKTQDILTSERSELEALRLEVSQAESVIATLKEDHAASQAQSNSLKSRNEELGEQYSLLWSSTSHPSKVKGDSIHPPPSRPLALILSRPTRLDSPLPKISPTTRHINLRH